VKTKRFAKLISLVVAALFGMLLSVILPAHAAVTSSSQTTMPLTTSAPYMTWALTPSSSIGGNISPGINYNSVAISRLTANYADSTGRLSTNTTSIAITMSGGPVATKDGSVIKSLYYDVFYKGASGPVSLVSGSPKNFATGLSGSVTVSGTQTLTLNSLADLKSNLPIYVGFRLITASGESASYYMATFNQVAPATTIDAPMSTDNKITGTGVSGNSVSTTINGQTYTAAVGTDGKYSITLKDFALNGVSQVTITQTPTQAGTAIYGEADGTATATVKAAPLTITSDKTALNLSSSDLSGFTSDSDVVPWLVSQAVIKGTNPSNANDTITYATSDSDILTTLKGLATNASATIHIYAQNASGLKSDPIAITVTKEGTLSFGTLSTDIGFGSLTVPNSEKLFAPTSSWNVNVDDTRTVGSTWTLSANATPMTSTTTSGRTLKGNLVYQDGSSKTVLTNNSTVIMTGTKASGTDATNVTSDWSGTTKGILLDAQSGIYADSYSGTVTWTLSDTATN